MDFDKVQAFAGKLITDVNGTASVGQVFIGDRLGLFRSLTRIGATTSEGLARETGLSERYLREWLGGMATAGYLTYDAASKTFTLPPEHAAVLADEASPAFLAAVPELVWGCFAVLPKIADAFKSGGGVAQAEFPPEVAEGQDRLSRATRAPLVGSWIDTAPRLKQRLSAGASLLDVGCGSGSSCLAMARAFPEARITGYDAYAPVVERARESARTEGLEGRVAFDVVDCAKLPRQAFDVITAFDVIHDAVDPLTLLTSIRNALAPDGLFLMAEPDGSPHVEENLHPMGQFRYAQSLFYCMTVSLAHGGAGLGATCGEAALRKLTEQAGFGSFERLPIADPMAAIYLLGR